MDTKALKQMLEKRSGHSLTSAADCEWLALDFKSRAGESIGVNTLKRLLGFREHDVARHYTSTLDTVARYLGYRSWSDVDKAIEGSSSNFGHNPEVVSTDDLSTADTVTITYNPDRKLSFTYKGNNQFVVSASENSKLSVGDIVVIHQFTLNNPLFVGDVIRNGKSLGEYTAAQLGGLRTIDVD